MALRLLQALGACAMVGVGAAAAAPLDPAWRAVGVTGDPFDPAVAVYFDATRLSSTPEGLAVHALWSYATPQGKSGFRAMRADVRMRCGEVGAATIHASFHADAGGSGPSLGDFVPDDIAWTTVEPKTLGAGLLHAACAEARRRGLS